MFDMFRLREDPNSDNPPTLPGYHVAPSNPDQENLRYYRGALAAGAGSITTTRHAFELFGAPAGFNVAVAIRPYRARMQPPLAPYFYPHG